MPAKLTDRLRDLAGEAPRASQVPPGLIRRARRRAGLTIGGAVAVALAFVLGSALAIRTVRQPRPELSSPTPPAFTQSWSPTDLAFGPDGELYVSTCVLGQIYRVAADGTITLVANARFEDGFSGDGGPALRARLLCPGGLAVGPDGALYLSDSGNNRVRRIDPSGTITTIVGSGPTGWGNGSFSGEGEPATQARLQGPTWIAFDDRGRLYIADRDNNAVRIVATDGSITTLLKGSSDTGYAIPGGRLSDPAGIAVGPDRAIYVADSNQARILRIDLGGTVSVVVGTGVSGYAGDGGPADEAQISNPGSLAFDPGGDLFIADTDNHVIRKVDAAGVITTVAGDGRPGCPVDGVPATSTSLTDPANAIVAPDGDLYFSTCQAIYRVDADGIVRTFAPR